MSKEGLQSACVNILLSEPPQLYHICHACLAAFPQYAIKLVPALDSGASSWVSYINGTLDVSNPDLSRVGSRSTLVASFEVGAFCF